MKKILIALVVLLPALCFAGPNTPALGQYMGHLQCATKVAFSNVDEAATTEASFVQAAEGCVPKEFKADITGLPAGVRPSTRDERVAALARSLKTREALCRQQKLSGAQCVKMFAASED
jgi:hypothetical protein